MTKNGRPCRKFKKSTSKNSKDVQHFDRSYYKIKLKTAAGKFQRAYGSRRNKTCYENKMSQSNQRTQNGYPHHKWYQENVVSIGQL